MNHLGDIKEVNLTGFGNGFGKGSEVEMGKGRFAGCIMA